METSARPEVLVAGNGGVETQLLVPVDLRGKIHVAQTCGSLPCWCGAIHQPDDATTLTILVGPDPPRLGSALLWGLTVGVVPHGRPELERNYALVHASSPRDFGPWAAAFVRHVAGCLLTPGLIGIDFTDLNLLFFPTRGLERDFVVLDPAAGLARREARAGSLYIVGRPDLSLDRIDKLAGRVAASLDPVGSLLVAASIDERLRVPLEASLILVR